MLVRDETPHSVLTPDPNTRTVHQVSTSAGAFTITVGPPSVELLMRLALRRSGLEWLAVFDQGRLFDFLIKQDNSGR